MSAPARQNTNAQIQLPHLPGAPDRVGQATAIEQSRAAAEVYAAVLAAKQAPRDVQQAIREMEEACRMRELADHAFFRMPRAGQQITGPTVHLARELARCWGNIQYGVSELRRDDYAGQSEMQAFAWDLQSNARSASIFIVPHARDAKRDGKKVVERLTDIAQVYESNANAGARRVREAVFAVLPLWFVEQAKTLCVKTIEDGGGKPLQQRIKTCVDLFAGLGVAEEQLVDKVGRPIGKWSAMDLVPLTVIYQSIQRGETSIGEEFEAKRVTAAEVLKPKPQAEKRAEQLASGTEEMLPDDPDLGAR